MFGFKISFRVWREFSRYSKSHKDTFFLRGFKTLELILRFFDISTAREGLFYAECLLYFVDFIEFFPSEEFDLDSAYSFVFRGECFGDSARLAAHVAV